VVGQALAAFKRLRRRHVEAATMGRDVAPLAAVVGHVTAGA
jgi:hypothetical protein